MEYIIAYYNEYGYTVCHGNNGQIIEEVYAAGNSKHSSVTSDSVPLNNHNCLSLLTIKKFARQTSREIARSKGVKFVGVQYDESNIEEIFTEEIRQKYKDVL